MPVFKRRVKKHIVKKIAPPPRMSYGEKVLFNNLLASGMHPGELALRSGRDRSSIRRAVAALKAGGARVKAGRPRLLTPARVNQIVTVLKGMVRKADGCWEVTLPMLMKRAKVKTSERTLWTALRKRRIYFRRMRSKPKLTKDDIKERYAFAKKFRKKTPAWWKRNLHMALDLKHFPVYHNAKGRAYAAAREVRGVYRAPGEGLHAGYTKVAKELRFNPGMKSVLVAAGVDKAKVRMWRALDSSWFGTESCTVSVVLSIGPC